MFLFKRFFSAVTAAVLLGVVSMVNANTYNEGFMAAESGDYKAAMKQWGPLAQQGHAIAQFNLALLYHSGSGLPVDEVEAISWYKKSAENGYIKAQEYLAVGYREGWFGLPKDAKKAAYWTNKIEENQ